MMRAPVVFTAADPEAGFTLIELIVALTIMGLLSLALFGGLRFGARSWERGTAHADGAEATLLAQNLLRRAISNAYPLLVTGDPTHAHIAFTGSADSLSLLAPVPAASAAGGRSQITFLAREADDKNGFDLVVTSRLELASGDVAATTAKDILLTHVRSLEFAYLGKARSDSGPAWHDEWTGQLNLPQIVRVKVRFADGDARQWPDLLIAPRIAVDVGCAYDPLTKYCRGR